jgi:hypothetical protein
MFETSADATVIAKGLNKYIKVVDVVRVRIEGSTMCHKDGVSGSKTTG